LALQAQQSASYQRRGFQSDQPIGEIPCPAYIESMMADDAQVTHEEEEQYPK